MAELMELPFETIEMEQQSDLKTYKIDFENGRIVGISNGIEAVRQSIQLVLMTPRFKCLIYSDQMGTEFIDSVIRKRVTHEYIEAQVPSMINDAIMIIPSVTGTSEFEIKSEGKSTYYKFKVETIYGDTEFKGAF